jgi:hypothetical protein
MQDSAHAHSAVQEHMQQTLARHLFNHACCAESACTRQGLACKTVRHAVAELIRQDLGCPSVTFARQGHSNQDQVSFHQQAAGYVALARTRPDLALHPVPAAGFAGWAHTRQAWDRCPRAYASAAAQGPTRQATAPSRAARARRARPEGTRPVSGRCLQISVRCARLGCIRRGRG